MSDLRGWTTGVFLIHLQIPLGISSPRITPSISVPQLQDVNAVIPQCHGDPGLGHSSSQGHLNQGVTLQQGLQSVSFLTNALLATAEQGFPPVSPRNPILVVTAPSIPIQSPHLMHSRGK